ncbi:alpha/beta hydrolase [Piscinibacter sakaiensis]|uniref:AB hydrolase-1 domain-containing protein n=1 Tax=Piscinibacter sakaiensis TaxID=1547922 RepID=A0A0K8P7E4_PISS1|nr:alpha/beta hydrolase [Piscinibacter sakaiensis]GAP38578.1 hypothetical protein ISF6_5131 [Piscinibacter sakaiensis]
MAKAWLATVLLVALLGCSGHASSADRFVMKVGVTFAGTDWTTTLSLQTRTGDVPSKGLVLFVPGSGGVGDPMLEQELLRPDRDLYRFGGWSKALLDAGYAVASYNTLGVRDTSACLHDLPWPQSPAAAFIAACIDQDVRRTVSLGLLEDELAAVAEMLGRYGKPVHLLATSAGGRVAAALIQAKRIQPASVVALSVPTGSLRQTFVYQWHREWMLQRLTDRLIQSGQPRLSARDAAQGLPGGVDAVLDVLRDHAVTLESLTAARFNWAWFTRTAEAHYRALPDDSPVHAQFLGFPIAAFYGARWFKDLFDDTQPVVERLADYPGELTFLLGAEDDRLPLVPAGACPGRAPPRCRVEVFPGLGHALSRDGRADPAVVEQVLQALRRAAAPAPPR